MKKRDLKITKHIRKQEEEEEDEDHDAEAAAADRTLKQFLKKQPILFRGGIGMHVPGCMHDRYLLGVSSLLTPCGSQKLNSELHL